MKHASIKKILLTLVLFLAFLLRAPLLGDLPALYTDEASLGYSAWSILKTGRDEFGTFLPVSLRSFGDWKPPLTSYMMIPFIATFGLNEIAVRAPSLFFGIGTIFLVYVLIAKGFGYERWGVLTAFLLAITPWHIHHSRMAMLVGPALFFLTLGILGWVMQDRGKFWRYASIVGFVAAIYGYYGSRVIVPLIFGFLLLIRYRSLHRAWMRGWVGPILVGIFLLSPLFLAFWTNAEVIFGRARHVSVFTDPSVRLRVWDDTTADGEEAASNVVRFWHNKPLAYIADILERTLQHLDPRFLFLTGDRAEPFELPGLGPMLWVMFPFFLLGLFRLIRYRPSGWSTLLAWMGIAIIPAALTFLTPASNRSFFMVVPLVAIASFGAELLFVYRHRLLLVIAFMLTILHIGYFLHQYYVRLPIELGDKYRYGLKDVVQSVVSKQDKYEKVVLSNSAAHFIYFLFYTKQDPIEYQQMMRMNPALDKFGFEHVDGYGKYEFRRIFNWREEPKHTGILYVAADHEVPGDVPIGYNVQDVIVYPNGRPAYEIIDL